jgi:polysaccharide deacetylase family protein (PEP-CTERM system associated)
VAKDCRHDGSDWRLHPLFCCRVFLEAAETLKLNMINVLTVDVEEYFHPTEVEACVERSQWGSLPSRVGDQIRRILDLFEKRGAKATFFVLGWVAENSPHVVRSIVAGGHEVGCHSYWHRLVYRQTPAEFKNDTLRSVKAIEDACGLRPRAYRAPSYSITSKSLWSLEILAECGFTIDSSIYPVSHDRYGIPGFGRHAQVMSTSAGPILEVPVATVQLLNGRAAPIGGGGYMRLLPYRYTAAGIRRLNHDEHQPACIYLHPWEIDPDQPRLGLGAISRLRTYTGVNRMYRKLDRLLSDFEFSSLGAVHGGLAPRRAASPAVANRYSARLP